jgi:hypothetical protein
VTPYIPIIAAIGAIAAILAPVIGSLRWRARTDVLVGRLCGSVSPPVATRGTGGAPRTGPDLDLDGLPSPVARYFRAVLSDSSPPVALARLEQRGQFLIRPGDPDGWRPFTAVEYFATRPAGFVWDARIRMAPGITVLVRDGFVDGRGSMTASVLGLKQVVSVEGTPAIAAGALQRYLAEAVWLPPALLPSAGVAWTPLGPTSARATLTADGTTVSVDFHFGADGLVERIYTDARERDVGGGRTEPTPWQGRFTRYAPLGGLRIPLAGEVEWLLPEGAQPYWRGEIVRAEYQAATDLAPAPGRSVHSSG